MSHGQLERLQFERLQKLVKYAWDNVPFYRRSWSASGFNPSDLKTLADFEALPMIDRNDVVERCEEFIPGDYQRGRLTKITTGGTSGMPMEFYIDNYKARAKEVAYVGYINRRYFGCRMFDRELLLRGDRIVDEKSLDNHRFWKYSLVKRGLAMSSFHLTGDNFRYYMAKLRSYDPHVIKAYPSSIYALCLLMKDKGEKPLRSLHAVICSSENVTETQRRLVKEVLGVDISSFYGHSEKCVVAFEGDSGQMLFHPLYGYTEFIGCDGDICSTPGQMAEVVVTGFAHDYFPLIRYRTNDVIEVGRPEGLYDKTASRIIGRESDFVYDRQSNHIIFTNSDEPFWNVRGVEAYQYVQDRPGELCVRLKVSPDYERTSENVLLEGIAEIFPGFDIRFHYVADIAKTPRGKFKYLIQNIKN